MPLNSIEKGMPKTEISIRPKAGKIKDSKKINKNVERIMPSMLLLISVKV